METAFQARIPWVILLALSAAAVAWLCRVSSFRPARTFERFSLLTVTVPLTLGLILASSDRLSRSDSAGAVDIHTLVKPESVLPLIPDIEPAADRAFVATKIAGAVRSAKPGSIGNVGFLARLKTDSAGVSGLESFRARVDAVARRSPPAQTVALLTRASFDALKPKLIVRTAGEFRFGLFLWCGLAMAAFWVVHVFWRVTGFEGDEALLPSVQFIAGVGLIVLTGLRDPLRDQTLVTEAAAGIVAGCAVLAVLSRIDWQRSAARLSFTPAICAFGLSGALILFGSGPGSSDAKVNLGPFQPAEAIKLLLVFSFAGYFGSRWMYLRQLRETRDKLAVLRRWRTPRLEDLAPILVT